MITMKEIATPQIVDFACLLRASNEPSVTIADGTLSPAFEK